MTIVKTLTLVSFIIARRRGFRKAFATFAIGSYWLCPELPMAMLKSQVNREGEKSQDEKKQQ